MELDGIELGFWKHPGTGEERWYVNNTHELAGLELHYYKTGNICAAYLGGEKISNGQARREMNELGKVWLTADGEIHTQHEGRHTEAIVAAVKDAQQKAAEEETPKVEEAATVKDVTPVKPMKLAVKAGKLATALGKDARATEDTERKNAHETWARRLRTAVNTGNVADIAFIIEFLSRPECMALQGPHTVTALTQISGR